VAYDNSKLTNLGQMKSVLQKVKSEIQAIDLSNVKSTVTTATLTSSNWVASGDIYKYSNVVSTSANMFYHIHLSPTTTQANSIIAANADIRAQIENNTIVLYAYGDVPTVNLSIEIVSTPTNSGNAITYDFGDVEAANPSVISNIQTAIGSKILFAESILIGPSAWAASEDADYPYKATFTMDGVTADYLSIVEFRDSDVLLYDFAGYSTTAANSVTIYCKTAPDSLVILPSVSCYQGTKVSVDPVGIQIGETLNDTPWSSIQAMGSASLGRNYWQVGDTKTITLNGTVGTLSLSNLQLQLFILGFDHNSSVEGTGISFGGFKLSGDTKNLALVDANVNTASSSGALWFNLEHWGPNAYGGWKGCDFRYDILGSTNVAPSGYGSVAVRGRIGYDPSNYNIVTAPKANTLLAALPQDLRSVMKPMTKWTNNVVRDRGATAIESDITTSVEYLTLLSQFEAFNRNTYSSSYESAKQQQYTYFAEGNSKQFYRHNNTSTATAWWLRSPTASGDTTFAMVLDIGDDYSNTTWNSRGIVPVLLVG